MTPFLRNQLGVQVEIFNALAASLVLGVMLIPTIATLSEDAMAAVPRDLRDGGYALGADKLQVSTKIVVPAAVSGIIAAFVLGFSRAVGRDDDRPHRRRSARADHVRSARDDRDDHRVHRRDGQR